VDQRFDKLALSRRALLRTATAGAATLAAATIVGPGIRANRALAQDQVVVRLISPPSSPIERGHLESVLDDFQAANPGIVVDYQAITSSYNAKLQTDLGAGTAADVFTLDSMPAPDLMAAGVMEPLDSYMSEAGVTAEDFYPGLIQAFQQGGVTYGLPKDFSTLAMVYDTQAFTDAGITAAPTTWEELRTAAQTLKESTGQAPIVFPPSFDRYIAFHYAGGAQILSEDGTQIVIDSPEANAALEFYYGLYTEELAATFTDVGAEWPGDAFAKSLASIVFEGNWVIEFLKANAPDRPVGFAPMPEGPGGPATMAFTVCYAINAQSENKDAAWTLVNYLTGAEGMAAWVDRSGVLPSRPALVQAYVEKYPDREVFVTGGEYARPWQLGIGGEKFNIDSNAELQALFADQQDVPTTISNLQSIAEDDITVGTAPAGTPVA